jgi:hypothetical protein
MNHRPEEQLTERERIALASALDIAIEQYGKFADTARTDAYGPNAATRERIVQQFNRQAREAQAIRDRIEQAEYIILRPTSIHIPVETREAAHAALSQDRG